MNDNIINSFMTDKVSVDTEIKIPENMVLKSVDSFIVITGDYDRVFTKSSIKDNINTYNEFGIDYIFATESDKNPGNVNIDNINDDNGVFNKSIITLYNMDSIVGLMSTIVGPIEVCVLGESIQVIVMLEIERKNQTGQGVYKLTQYMYFKKI